MDSLHFVSFIGGEPPKDPVVKRLIRRRAMKHNAVVRKKNGGYARLNPIQPPAWLAESRAGDQGSNPGSRGTFPDMIPNRFDGHDDGVDGQESDTMQLAAKKAAMMEGSLRWRAGYKPQPLTSFRTGNLANYSLLNLTNPLTLHHPGISTLSYFCPDTNCIGITLTSMPEYAKKRLLTFVPSLYGHFPALTYACDSVVARLEQLIYSRGIWSPEKDFVSLKPYTKSITALQKAINDESLRLLPETLCTILLLGVFELLHGGSLIDSWMHHARGAAQLIELRGPGRFQTDFELSLFMTHAGPIITEALLTGKRCFLYRDDWQTVLRAAIRNDPIIPPDQAHLAIDLWASLTKAPNLMQDVKDLFFNPISPGRRQDLIRCLLAEYEHMKRWLVLAEQYQYGTNNNRWLTLAEGATALLQEATFREQPIAWRVLIGTYSLNLLVNLRLLFALSPLQFSEMESVSQIIAKRVAHMVEDLDSYKNDRLVGGLFKSQTLWMAKAVLSTRDCWGGGMPPTESSGMIDGWRFKTWTDAMVEWARPHPGDQHQTLGNRVPEN